MKIPFFKNTLHQILEGGTNFSFEQMSNAKSHCEDWMRQAFSSPVFFTKSCSQSLELAILALDLPEKSEVIVPSYGFVSVANAVVLAGHKCVFADCDPRTLNLCPSSLETLITANTGAVITINYAGIPCDYDRIVRICKANRLWLIEDNAHGLLSYINERPTGSFGDISTVSFDSVKMITSFEGGALVVNNSDLLPRIEEITEMGTDKLKFVRGDVPQYQWVRSGTNASLALPLFQFLWIQLEQHEKIKASFKEKWRRYSDSLQPISGKYQFQCSFEPEDVSVNGYSFWITLPDAQTREELQEHMSLLNIQVSRHYPALHLSEMGKQLSSVEEQQLPSAEHVAQTIIRLPLYMNMTEEEVSQVIDGIHSFFERKYP